MKILITLVISSLLLMSFTSDKEIARQKALLIKLTPNPDTILLQRMTVADFKHRLARIESGGSKNEYTVVNRYGYKGKYQMSNYYIAKYTGVSPRQFLQRPDLQEHAMNQLCILYLHSIARRAWDKKYINTLINGVTITLEGLMAGMHQHPRALKLWLESNGKINLTDGNKVPVSYFVKQFKPKLCENSYPIPCYNGPQPYTLNKKFPGLPNH